MATVYKRVNSKNYYYRFTVNGVEENRSCHTDNYNTAVKVMNARIKEVSQAAGPRDLFDRLLRSIQEQPLNEQEELKRNFAQSLMQEVGTRLRIEQTWETYEQRPKKSNPREEHLARTKAKWIHFTTWLHQTNRHITHLDQIDHRLAQKYMDDVWKQGITPSTYNKYLTALKTIFSVVRLDAGLKENIWNQIERMSARAESRKMLTLDQLERVLKLAEGEMKLLLLIGTYTGLRLRDCVKLKWADIDLLDQRLELIQSKTQQPLRLSIHPVLFDALEAAPRKSATWVIPEFHALYQSNSSMITTRVRNLFEKAGIKTRRKRAQGQKSISEYGFHSLRHTLVSALHAEGVPQIIAQAIVGHNNRAVHETYKHTTHDQIQSAILKLPTINHEI